STLKNRCQMLGPSVQGGPHLARIFRAVINTGNPALVARDVVDDRLNDVRRNVEIIVKTRNDRPTYIVQSPRTQRCTACLCDARVELSFAAAKGSEARITQ